MMLPTTRDTTIARASGAIPDSSEKIVLCEEDTTTIDDGHWVAPYYDANGVRDRQSGANLLAIRHDHTRAKPDSGLDPLPNADRRGNVNFIDGHAEFVTRQYAHYQGHLKPLADK